MVWPFARSKGGSSSSVAALIAVEMNALISAAGAGPVAASSARTMANALMTFLHYPLWSRCPCRRDRNIHQPSGLIDRLAACHGPDDRDVLDLVLVHRMRIIRQDDEVRELPRRDGPFDGFLIRSVRAVDREHPQRLVD